MLHYNLRLCCTLNDGLKCTFLFKLFQCVICSIPFELLMSDFEEHDIRNSCQVSLEVSTVETAFYLVMQLFDILKPEKC
jgi:hypothetical protein